MAAEHPLTLGALIAAADPTATALLHRDETIAYGELRDRASRVAAGLRQLGIGRGDRVAIWLPNDPAWLELQFALARLGALAVAVNTRFGPREVEDVLERSGARALALGPAAREVLDAVDPHAARAVETLIAVGDVAAPGHRVVKHDELRVSPPLAEDAAEPSLPCSVFTSSGTTGRPKLVLHGQAAIAGHSANVAEAFGYRAPETVVLGMLPLCGVFGFNTALGALAAHAPLVLQPTFEAREAIELVARHRVTHTNGSDEMLRRILAATDDHGALGSLREAGFAAFDGDARALVDAGDAIGLSLFMAYGSSEAQALMARSAPGDPPERRAIAGGLPVSEAIEVRVRDEDGALQPPGREGELEVRGPNVTIGYLGDDEARRTAFTDDGFLRTGDIGRLRDDGGFEFVARAGDALRLGGFLVSPREIAELLEGIEAVLAAQVVAVEHEGRTRAVAFVVLQPGEELDELAAIDLCRARLARYKVPRRVLAVDAFPTTPSPNGEKVRRGELRRMAAQALPE
jgi:fatty-acyl-CoA synthase